MGSTLQRPPHIASQRSQAARVQTRLASLRRTGVAGVYGMNFEFMPEFHWPMAIRSSWAARWGSVDCSIGASNAPAGSSDCGSRIADCGIPEVWGWPIRNPHSAIRNSSVLRHCAAAVSCKRCYHVAFLETGARCGGGCSHCPWRLSLLEPRRSPNGRRYVTRGDRRPGQRGVDGYHLIGLAAQDTAYAISKD